MFVSLGGLNAGSKEKIFNQGLNGGQFSQHWQQDSNQTGTTNRGNGGGLDGGQFNHQQHQSPTAGLYLFNNDGTNYKICLYN